MGISPLGAEEIVVRHYTEHRVIEPGDRAVPHPEGHEASDGVDPVSNPRQEATPLGEEQETEPPSASSDPLSRDDPGETSAVDRGLTLDFGEDNLQIAIGDTVGYEVVDAPGEVRYVQIVPSRGDPQAGSISPHAPLAVQLLGKRRGDEVKIPLPQGDRRLRIVEIVRHGT
jgi:hypothetical protein